MGPRQKFGDNSSVRFRERESDFEESAFKLAFMRVSGAVEVQFRPSFRDNVNAMKTQWGPKGGERPNFRKKKVNGAATKV